MPDVDAAGDRISAMSGRAAIVTGASSGIGRATAVALAQRGARVLAVARSERDLAALASETGVEVLAVSLATAEGCERTVAEAHRRLGSVDILVNNAGVDLDGGRPIWEARREDWEQTLALNLDAPFALTRQLSGEMVKRGWGRIIMVASTAGQTAAPGNTAYCTSKHGLVGLMRAVAQDVAPFGVTCNAVMPGWVRTATSERSAAIEAERSGRPVEEIWAERAAGYAAGRVLAPAEIAEVIAFLASDAASGVNGEPVTVALGGLW
jgi:NAD(P)-dependent dehydrogenase (short-subunit alcohol dehydrogenase family)